MIDNYQYGTDPAGEGARKADQELLRKFKEKAEQEKKAAAGEPEAPASSGTTPAAKPASGK